MTLRWLRAAMSRVAGLFAGSRRDRELREEIESHLQLHIDDNVRAGMTPMDARRQALLKLGGVEAATLAYRDRSTIPALEQLMQDARFAVRQLRRNPGFAGTAVGMLALGLAASVAIFAFVDAALIAPLPYADQSRLVLAFNTRLTYGGRGFVSYPEFRDWRAGTRAFSGIDAFDVRAGSTLTTSAGAERVSSLTVTAGFFHTLGVAPLLGRDFLASEEGDAAPAVTMVSYGAWQTRFGSRSDVVGQTVTLNGEPHLIVGVLPRAFHFTRADPADFWIPVHGGNYCRGQRGCRSMQVIARVAPGMTMPAASADLQSVAQRLREEYPDTNSYLTADITPLRDVLIGDVRPLLLVLMSGVGLLLLIACLNIVSLLLVRSAGRTREMAVRDALGASTGRLLWQFATEACLLVVAGGTLGLLLTIWGMRALLGLLSDEMLGHMPYLQGLALNARTMTFAGGVLAAAWVLFTLAPMLRLRRGDRSAGLADGSRGAASTAWRRVGAQLVVIELAIAVILLVGAGLLGKSLLRLLQVDIGLNPDRLAIVSVSVLPDGSMPRTAALPTADLTLSRQVAERLRALPGVEAVGYAEQLPLSPGGAPTTNLQVPGRPFPDPVDTAHPVRRVGPGYFAALGARMLRGRGFTEAEVATGQRVAVINQSAAQRYFAATEDPIGQDILTGSPGPGALRWRIVGIVADLKDGSLEAPPRPAIYRPFDQTGCALVIRTSLPTEALASSIVAAIRGVRPGLFVSPIDTMSARLDRQPSAYLHRSSAWLAGGFAALAFLLSVIGLYGVIAYSVSQRNREIGVRMALGAQQRTVYRLVLGEASRLTLAGIVLGLIGAVMASSLMRGLLFGVAWWDASTLVGVSIVLAGAALLASYVPARRAASVNPVEALRAE